VLTEQELPAGLRPIDTPPDGTSQEQQLIDVWFVRDASLASTTHRVAAPVEPADAVDEVLAGPSESEQDNSLRSAIPDPEAVVGVTVVGGVATVELTNAFAEIPANDQVLAVGQLVLTLTDLRGVGRVRFVVDDVHVAVPLPTGETADESVSRDDYLVLTGS
jgi:spore germination protein GerM